MKRFLSSFAEELLSYTSLGALLFFIANLADAERSLFRGIEGPLLLVVFLAQACLLGMMRPSVLGRVLLGSSTALFLLAIKLLTGGFAAVLDGDVFLLVAYSLLSNGIQAFAIAFSRFKLQRQILELPLGLLASTAVWLFASYAIYRTPAFALVPDRRAADIASFFGFIFNGEYLFVIYPAIAFTVAVGTALAIARARAISTLFRTKRLFERAESPKDGGEARALPGASRRNVAVLYADIRKFTEIAEKAKPDEVSQLLRMYFAAWETLISERGGVIDKYMGDSLQAAFGIDGQGEPCEQAVLAAEEFLKERLKLLQAELAARSLPVIRSIGIGISYGEVMIGAFGGGDPWRNRIIGEAANASARLEGLCREFKQNLVISSEVYKHIPIELQTGFAPLGEILMRGSQSPTPIYGKN
jgi:class 3 adenylate cyclase